MSSFVRNMQRRQMRKARTTTDEAGNTVRVEHKPKPQHTFSLPDGGYTTIRYTKGARVVSAARLRAQGCLAEITGAGTIREQERSVARILAGVEELAANEKRIDALQAAPVAAVTRQMRRHALRTGRAIPETVCKTAAAKPARKSRAKTVASQQAAA